MSLPEGMPVSPTRIHSFTPAYSRALTRARVFAHCSAKPTVHSWVPCCSAPQLPTPPARRLESRWNHGLTIIIVSSLSSRIMGLTYDYAIDMCGTGSNLIAGSRIPWGPLTTQIITPLSVLTFETQAAVAAIGG